MVIMKLVSDRLKKLYAILRKRERFLVLEILNRFIRVSSVKADFSRKRLEVLKTVGRDHQYESQDLILELLKSLLRGFGKLDRYRIIVCLDPALATTIYSTVVLVRDKPKEPIDESDLNNRIAQGIWRLFDRERAPAAVKMKSRDLDVLLTDVKVRGIKLDGHKVVNPIGFKAKTVELKFTQTFNPRALVVGLKKLLPPENLALLAESGVMAADILAKTGRADNFLLLELLREKSNLFFSDGSTIAHLNTLNWGKQNFLSALSDAFLVSQGSAEKIFELYLLRQASPFFLKKVEKMFLEQFDELIGCLEKPASRYRPAFIYLLSLFDLPEFIFGAGFRLASGDRAKFIPVTSAVIDAELGFSIKSKKALARESLFSPLSSILSFYFSPHDDKMNAIARRHARWLIS